jgi:hypothetical protein
MIWGKDPGYVRLSLYSENIERFTQVFQFENLLLLPFNVLKNSKKLYPILTQFLGYKIQETGITHSNKSDNNIVTIKRYFREIKSLIQTTFDKKIGVIRNRVKTKNDLESILDEETRELLIKEELLLDEIEKSYDI